MLTRHLFLKSLFFNVAWAFLLVVAVLLGQNQLYLMAAILFLIPRVSYVLGRLMQGKLDVERIAPSSCRDGERIAVTLTVRNAGWMPRFLFRAEDKLGKWLTRVEGQSDLILSLGAEDASRVTYLIEAEKRGVHLLGPTAIVSTDPLGFYTFTQTLPGTSELLVYPTPIPVSRSFLAGASSWGWQEQENARSRGDGVDFQGVREYRPGDELRRVHWRTTARTGKLVVTEYTQGFMADAVIALDINQDAYRDTGEGRESALEYAVTIAVTLCDDLIRSGSKVRLLLPQTAADVPRDKGGPEQMARILDLLARVEADSEVTLAGTLQTALPTLAFGATVVYISPDIGRPDLAAAVQEYAARGARLFGFAMDGASFRGAPAAPTPSAGSGLVQSVHRGDNIQHVIESMAS